MQHFIEYIRVIFGNSRSRYRKPLARRYLGFPYNFGDDTTPASSRLGDQCRTKPITHTWTKGDSSGRIYQLRYIATIEWDTLNSNEFVRDKPLMRASKSFRRAMTGSPKSGREVPIY